MSDIKVGDKVRLTSAVVTDDVEPGSPWSTLRPGDEGVVSALTLDGKPYVRIEGNDPSELVDFYVRSILEAAAGPNDDIHGWPLQVDQIEKVEA